MDQTELLNATSNATDQIVNENSFMFSEPEFASTPFDSNGDDEKIVPSNQFNFPAVINEPQFSVSLGDAIVTVTTSTEEGNETKNADSKV